MTQPGTLPNSEAPSGVGQGTVITVRAGVEDDWPILESNFANLYCGGERKTGRLSFYGFRVPPHLLVQKLRALRLHPEWKLLVATPAAFPDEVLGLLLVRPGDETRRNPEIGWIAVKPWYTRDRGFWRKKGIATLLLKSVGITPHHYAHIDCAFMMVDTMELARTKGYNLRFRPYIPDVALWDKLETEGNSTSK